jgi:selenocysteine lyase/cysteine desulfurase
MSRLDALRSLFPICGHEIYLNHAAMAPPSVRVVDALARYARIASEHAAADYGVYEREVERVRGAAASLIGATPGEVAFVRNTTEGLGIVASGFPWREGDRVVSCDLEYPSNVTPWLDLHERGVQTQLLPTQAGRLDFAAIEAALRDPSVRMLAVSSVQFGSGQRLDLPAVGALCRERGVLLCVDAIQSLGCLPLDVEACSIDFLAAGGHKWLLSLEGCGLFYCARRMLGVLRPHVMGLRNARDPEEYDGYQRDLAVDSRRFEEGTLNTPGIFALGAAVDLLEEAGIAAVAERVLGLTDRLIEGLRALGCELLSPLEPSERSGIVSFRFRAEPPDQTVARLAAAGITVRSRRGGVRVSPHFYNTTVEIDALLNAL